MTIDRWLASMPRTLLVCATAAIASQVGPAATTWTLLPAFPASSRSPSSDVMAQALPLPAAGEVLGTLARDLPITPGVIVVQGSASTVVAAYYVASTHLWPRPIMLVSCEPHPVRHFPFSAAERRPVGWRIDMRPGEPSPIRATVDRSALRSESWCGDPAR